jgi:hypothetical protein
MELDLPPLVSHPPSCGTYPDNYMMYQPQKYIWKYKSLSKVVENTFYYKK